MGYCYLEQRFYAGEHRPVWCIIHVVGDRNFDSLYKYTSKHEAEARIAAWQISKDSADLRG